MTKHDLTTRQRQLIWRWAKAQMHKSRQDWLAALRVLDLMQRGECIYAMPLKRTSAQKHKAVTE